MRFNYIAISYINGNFSLHTPIKITLSWLLPCLKVLKYNFLFQFILKWVSFKWFLGLSEIIFHFIKFIFYYIYDIMKHFKFIKDLTRIHYNWFKTCYIKKFIIILTFIYYDSIKIYLLINFYSFSIWFN